MSLRGHDVVLGFCAFPRLYQFLVAIKHLRLLGFLASLNSLILFPSPANSTRINTITFVHCVVVRISVYNVYTVEKNRCV